MGFREYVVGVYVIVFIIALGAIGSIPADYWKYIPDGQKASIAVNTFLGFCGILIAYWVYDDGKKLDYFEQEKFRLEKRISDVDGKYITLMKEKKRLEERVSELERKT